MNAVIVHDAQCADHHMDIIISLQGIWDIKAIPWPQAAWGHGAEQAAEASAPGTGVRQGQWSVESVQRPGEADLQHPLSVVWLVTKALVEHSLFEQMRESRLTLPWFAIFLNVLLTTGLCQHRV